MTEFKGTGILFLRQRARTLERLPAVLALLGEEDARTFEETMAGTWVSVTFADRAFTAAAKALLPELMLDDALRELGRQLALDNLRGVYAFLARVTSLHFVLRNAATFYRVYHRVGKAAVSRDTDGGDIAFAISDYDHMPENFRTATCGWCEGTAEVCQEPYRFRVDEGAPRWTLRGVRKDT